MCPSGATYLSEDCCFCELAFKNWTQRVGLKQSGSNNHLIIYCLKSSQVTPITFSDLLLIYMFLVLFGILVYISPFFLPMFLSCLSLTNIFVFHIWCRARMTPLEYFAAIWWRSVLLVEENGQFREYHRPVTSHWQTVSHNVASNTLDHERDSTPQCGDIYWLRM